MKHKQSHTDKRSKGHIDYFQTDKQINTDTGIQTHVQTHTHKRTNTQKNVIKYIQIERSDKYTNVQVDIYNFSNRLTNIQTAIQSNTNVYADNQALTAVK